MSAWKLYEVTTESVIERRYTVRARSKVEARARVDDPKRAESLELWEIFEYDPEIKRIERLP